MYVSVTLKNVNLWYRLGMSIARAHPWAGYWIQLEHETWKLYLALPAFKPCLVLQHWIPVHDDVEPTGHFLGTIKCVLFQNFKS